MADFVRIFVVDTIGETYKLLADLELLLARAERVPGGSAVGAAATRAQIQKIRHELSRDLDVVAATTATEATTSIRAYLDSSQKRPSPGHGARRLRDGIKSVAIKHPTGFGTGVVGIASEAELNKVVNPAGPQYGPFWQTQEYGYRGHLGRVLRGHFFGPGYSDPDRPRAEYAGAARPPHPIFVTARAARAAGAEVGVRTGGGKRGGSGGKGIIRHPIRARHFIRDGANDAQVTWRNGIRAAELRAIVGLRRIGL